MSSFNFVQLFASSLAVSTGESPYAPQRLAKAGLAPAQRRAPDLVHPNLNAPFSSPLLVPLTGLGLARSYIVWSGCSVLAVLVSGWILWRTLNRQQRKHRELVWLWIALLAYYPTHTAPMLGQVTFVPMVPVVDAWPAACRGVMAWPEPCWARPPASDCSSRFSRCQFTSGDGGESCSAWPGRQRRLEC